MAKEEPEVTATNAKAKARKTLARYLVDLEILAALTSAALQLTWIRGVFGL